MMAMLRKVLNYALIVASCALILLVGFTLGTKSALVRGGIDQAYSQTGAVAASSTPDMAIFWETWKLVNEKYLRAEDISDQQKVRGAAAGLVASLEDPYSQYFAPTEAAEFKDEVQGNFGGIGAQMDSKDGVVTVVSPLKGSPAEAAGLKSGDQIIFVDATSTQGFSTEEVVKIIRGPVGTSVKLTVKREGLKDLKEITIVRQDIVVPTIDLTMKDGGIAYIQLYQFNASASELFLKAIREAALSGTRGVVLDLRGNPGGYLNVAVKLASWFLPRGTLVVSQQGRDGEKTEAMRANGNAALANIPTVILIDEGSASASEILAGALRDQRKIPLVGQTSFGKGTVQEIKDLSDGSIVKLTVAHWVLPSGHILEGAGLKPDYEVKLTDDDIKKKRDPQLDKALQVLRDMF
jgi:carboxyl-terminal processing protease